MELVNFREKWFYNEKRKCWCLTDVLYTEKAMAPEYQRLSIFVPKPYMKEKGVIDEEGRMNGYNARNVPVVFENNSAGYMQMKHKWLDDGRCMAQQYLDCGFVYISCGNRGKESVDEHGLLCGKVPANLVDLKTAIRFLRYNQEWLPGNYERIISVGCSAGGAMSTLLAVTGNHRDYEPYLRENGAIMEERDDVYAAQIYCPIIDLEHADLAYEWNFGADRENEASHAGPAGVMTPFQEALSRELRKRYIRYFNNLKLKHPQTDEILTLGDDGRSGSGYSYLMDCLENSAADFLRRKKDSEVSDGIAVNQYVSERKEWLDWDGEQAHIRDLDIYVLEYRRRMKPCTAFDILNGTCNENEVFGTAGHPFIHFSREVAESIQTLKESFPQEYEQYYESYRKDTVDEAQAQRVSLYNPMNYIGKGREGNAPDYYRIRVGAFDADTSWAVSMALALRLSEAGKNVDYALVWDQPHGQADYPGEVCGWIEQICRKE
ncbi:hypothetical protein NXH76_25270 [Blautia schinkii]|nr:hypothetical protein [Blautia schinkii]